MVVSTNLNNNYAVCSYNGDIILVDINKNKIEKTFSIHNNKIAFLNINN